ncbi:uncharacterized protein NEMAJ01_0643 [Nematocida major]|uniref:uncharacterized protein n=1 Tax=Nematocida major TaxID=1912982 RepID=UPI002007AA58|nr:uncharacterized protein NEMAJ01_0643 [Nematocida major]KAH9385747.1 hypothetical protein NEMAJ01_0643 [Nematocida major]
MKSKKIRGEADQQQLRRRIEMRYEPNGAEKKPVQEDPSIRAINVKKMLISYYMKTMQAKRVYVDESQRMCGFCHTKETSLWRRIGDIVVCNACGLYYRIHGKMRNKDITRGRKARPQEVEEQEGTDDDNYEE